MKPGAIAPHLTSDDVFQSLKVRHRHALKFTLSFSFSMILRASSYTARMVAVNEQATPKNLTPIWTSLKLYTNWKKVERERWFMNEMSYGRENSEHGNAIKSCR